jgi:hypothetical protein
VAAAAKIGLKAIAQLWLFWVAPIVGGALGGVAYHALTRERPVVPREVAQPEAVLGTPPRRPSPA